MTKSIFEKISLDAHANKALQYAHSSEYAHKRKTSQNKSLLLQSIRKKKTKLKTLLG